MKLLTEWVTTVETRADDGATEVVTREEKIQDQKHTRGSVTVVDSRRTDIVIRVSRWRTFNFINVFIHVFSVAVY